MHHEGFMVYQASAGSGKTFQLALRFLHLCLSTPNHNVYRQILAITFTKKAAREMKDRVIETLEQVSTGKETGTSKSLMVELLKSTGMEEKELRRKSSLLLTELLHDYSRFSMMTIDSFTQRLVRSFAHDLQLPLNLEIELNQDVVLDLAIDFLLDEAQDDEGLSAILDEYTRSFYQNSSSLKLRQQLEQLGKDLMNEEYASLLERFKSWEYPAEAYEKEEKILNNYRDEWKKLKSAFRSTMAANGLTDQDLTRKSSLANVILEVENRDWYLTKPLTFQKNILKGSYVSSKHPQKSEIDPHLDPHFKRALELKNQDAKRALEAKIFIQERDKLRLLSKLQSSIQNIYDAQGMVHISAINRILNEEIKDQPAPFVFERIGEKFKHFFIDEFQDTSVVQWENLIPLVENALAGDEQSSKGNGPSCFLVGDAKQSIYQWRGGDAAQFIDLGDPEKSKYKFKDLEHKKHLVHREKDFKNQNFRSREEVIKFNNGFYQALSPNLALESEIRAFETAFQNPGKTDDGKILNPGGYAEVTVYEKASKGEDSNALKWVVDCLKKAEEAGYSHGEIAVLVRGHAEGKKISDYLVGLEGENYSVVSADSLKLMENKSVVRVVSMLEYIAYPDSPPAQLGAYQGGMDAGILDARSGHEMGSLKQREALLKERFPVEQWKKMALFPLVQSVVSTLYPQGHYDVFLTSLLDLALDFSGHEEEDLHAFLKHLEETDNKVEMAGDPNSIRLLTYHASKGLEFPVVIIPHMGQEILKNHPFWVDLEGDPRAPAIRLMLSQKDHLPEFLDGKIQAKFNRAKLEVMDLLYVATTRAQDLLFIGAEIPGKSETKEKVDHWIYKWMQGETVRKAGDFEIQKTLKQNEKARSREKPKAGLPPENFDKRVSAQNDWVEKIRIAKTFEKSLQTEKSFGNLVHNCLENIYDHRDLEAALNQALNKGVVREDGLEGLRKRLESLVFHPELKAFFEPGKKSMNERSFLQLSGEVGRPDRVVLLEDKWVVLDYKTGKKREEHLLQIAAYKEALKAITELPVEALLVYIHENDTEILKHG